MGKFNSFGEFKYKYNIGDLVVNKVGTQYRILNFKIAIPKNKSRHYKHQQNTLWYYVEYPKCGRTMWVESVVLTKRKCACETNNNFVVHQGINDIPTTDYWMVDYFVNGIEEAKKYTSGSTKKALMKCPYCGRTKMQEIAALKSKKRIHCICSDSCSYPEKFLTSVLEQLGVDFIAQATSNNLGFDVDRRAYDFYIPEYSCIIETHGNQHYAKTTFFNTNVKDVQEIDKYKEETALKNGIHNYITLDCRHSTLKWIKKSIMDSAMPSLFNFKEKDIKWKLCEKECATNLIKDVCDYYMKTMEGTRAIGKKYHKTYTMISYYLTKGANAGWCVYDSEISKGTRKPIKIIFDGEEYLFSGVEDIVANSWDRIRISFNLYNIYKHLDNNKEFKGCRFEHITNPKEKCIALYGERAVKWYEEHPEFNS